MNVYSQQRGPCIFLTLFLCGMFLQACSLQPALDSSPQAPSSLTAMANNIQINQWQLSGKIGIRSQQQSETAYLNWRQCQDTFDIRLSGPLGQGTIQLNGNAHRVSLKTSKGDEYSAPNAEQLMAQQLGWQLPMTELLYWVRGLPAPTSVSQASKINNGFEQSGWQVHFQKPVTVKQYTLPGKVIAIHPQMKITLILKQWDIDNGCRDDHG